jgi:hypothetical protein
LKIVAVGRQFTASPGDGPAPPPSNNVTFLVTPDQARMLELAASTARPWLVLRSGRDKAAVAQDRTYLSQLHGLSQDEALGMPLPDTRPTTGPSESALADANAPHHNFVNVEVIRGSTVSHVTLPMPADLGGSGLPLRSEAAPANSGQADRPSRTAAKPAGGRPGAEVNQSPRPSAFGDVDQSDAFKSDPFNSGSSR